MHNAGMIFAEKIAKGLQRCLVDPSLVGEPLHYHISHLDAGARPHDPHRHGGCEAIHMLEGEAVLELDDERQLLRAGEGMIFNPTRLHGLVNLSTSPARYLVMIHRVAGGKAES